ncbi:MAG: O-antigen ligase family protein [Phycisphaerales bacterium]|nr:O-antigen ligase family protein [Phycisphaerales bacterium]
MGGIREAVLLLFCMAMMVVAVRRWYWSLCSLMFLTVVMQHPSMPKMILGIQGMNPWNATFLVIAVFWMIDRLAGRPRARTSPIATVLFVSYFLMILVAGILGAVDAGSVKMGQQRFNTGWMIVDGMINPLKYLMVGLMFYDGVRSRNDVWMALLSAVGSGFAYAGLMFKSMNIRVFTIDYEDARRMTDKLIGLFANDMGELLAFTMWSAVFVALLLRKRWQQIACWAVNVATLPPFIALKSRAGFLAFCAVGLALGGLRWRKILLLLPVVVVGIIAVSPSARDRVTTGFAEGGEDANWDEISAGRLTNIWPPVIEEIEQSPLFGYGRYAILRQDCAFTILEGEGQLPLHPHNSYLEILLDCGALGLILCLLCMAGLFTVTSSLMRTRGDPLTTTIGAVGFIAVVAELTAGVAGSSFYPGQSSVPYLCIWGTAMRLRAELTQARKTAPATSVSWSPANYGRPLATARRPL